MRSFEVQRDHQDMWLSPLSVASTDSLAQHPSDLPTSFTSQSSSHSTQSISRLIRKSFTEEGEPIAVSLPVGLPCEWSANRRVALEGSSISSAVARSVDAHLVVQYEEATWGLYERILLSRQCRRDAGHACACAACSPALGDQRQSRLASISRDELLASAGTADGDHGSGSSYSGGGAAPRPLRAAPPGLLRRAQHNNARRRTQAGLLLATESSSDATAGSAARDGGGGSSGVGTRRRRGIESSPKPPLSLDGGPNAKASPDSVSALAMLSEEPAAAFFGVFDFDDYS